MLAFGADIVHQSCTQHWTQSSVFHTWDFIFFFLLISQYCPSKRQRCDNLTVTPWECFVFISEWTQIHLNLHLTPEAWIKSMSFTCRSVPVNFIYCITKQINLFLEIRKREIYGWRSGCHWHIIVRNHDKTQHIWGFSVNPKHQGCFFFFSVLLAFKV